MARDGAVGGPGEAAVAAAAFSRGAEAGAAAAAAAAAAALPRGAGAAVTSETSPPPRADTETVREEGVPSTPTPPSTLVAFSGGGTPSPSPGLLSDAPVTPADAAAGAALQPLFLPVHRRRRTPPPALGALACLGLLAVSAARTRAETRLSVAASAAATLRGLLDAPSLPWAASAGAALVALAALRLVVKPGAAAGGGGDGRGPSGAREGHGEAARHPAHSGPHDAIRSTLDFLLGPLGLRVHLPPLLAASALCAVAEATLPGLAQLGTVGTSPGGAVTAAAAAALSAATAAAGAVGGAAAATARPAGGPAAAELVCRATSTLLALLASARATRLALDFKTHAAGEAVWRAELRGEVSRQRRVLALDRAAGLGVRLLGALAAARAAGFHVGSVATIGGFGTLAVGLAGRDILENLFSGLVILSSNPFEVGEEVAFCPTHETRVEGFVTEVGWYRTTVRSYEREIFTIPNSLFSKSVVLNITRKRGEWRFFERIGVRVEDVAPALAGVSAIRAVLRADPRVIQRLHRRIFLEGVSRDQTTVYLSFYVAAANRDAFMAIKQELLVSCLACLQAAGCSLAVPRLQLESADRPASSSGAAGADGAAAPGGPAGVDLAPAARLVAASVLADEAGGAAGL